MIRSSLGIAVSVLCSVVCCGCISISALGSGRIEEVVVRRSPRWLERDKIAIIDVDGVLGPEETLLVPGTTTVADVREKLERAAADRGVRAVVMRINSPGGEASAADTIYQEVRRFRTETGKPVVAALMGTAASGGYYVALAADRIVASPTSVTGSVGVVMHFTNVEGLFAKLGLRSETIKSGEKKDIGSLTRAMTDEERQILQGVITALFDRFLGTVRERRPEMTDADLAAVSDGRVLTADQALDLHMVDRTGYLSDALDIAMELAGVEDADVILYRPFRHYNANIYAALPMEGGLIGEGLNRLLRRKGPTFLYLWSPGS